MRNRLEVKIGTFEKIRLFLISFFIQLNGVPIFAALKAEYETKLSELVARAGKADEIITGGTTDKQNARILLSILMRKLSGMIVIHAFDTNDNLLRKKFKYPKSRLVKKDDSELYTFGTTHLSYATTLATQLTALGYTAADLAAFTAALNNYHSMMQLPRNKAGERTHALVDTGTLEKELDDLLNYKIDGVVMYVEAGNPGIMIEYKIARSIDNTGHTSVTPDYEGTLAPNTIMEIAELQYTPTRSFKVKVKTTQPAIIGLSSNTTGFEGTPVTIVGNSTFIVSSGNLGTSGMNHLILQNADGGQALEYAITVING